ncbi:hypothetical protein F511_40617 [Dorcoceras hygrometricum]|uniref:Uncharacterized protein n=1 Tax=Dorcoceras hygrometricum TaxID=472368 RepID=A0A2Z7BQI7_9LAMI|nr:hypothetical protein F511_40617 [Dorcoceras hygrometricum]
MSLDLEASQVGDAQTDPADDIQANPTRSKSSMKTHSRVELKVEELYSIKRVDLSYEVQGISPATRLIHTYMLYATGILNHLLGHSQLGYLLYQLYDLDNTTGNKQTKPQRDMGSNPSTESQQRYNMHSSIKSATDTVATVSVGHMGVTHSPPTRSSIPGASITPPAVAQPMNCGS